jgi:cation-transporting ATPase E
LKRVLSFAIPAGVISSLTIFSAYLLADLEDLTTIERQTAATIAALCVSLWILAVLARPYNRWKLALLWAMAGIAVAAITIPPVRDFFELSLPVTFLPQALAIGAAGAAGVEIVWRVAFRWSDRHQR